MVKIDVQLKQSASDFRWVTDPWNGWEFEIARENYGPFRQWAEKNRKNSRYYRQVARAGQANLVLNQDGKASEKILGKMIESLDPEDLEKLGEMAKDGMAEVRIRAVRGVVDSEGRPIGYTPDLGKYLLSLDVPVREWIDEDDYFDADGKPKTDADGEVKKMPREDDLAWISLGDALFRFLSKQSAKLELFRTDLLEAARKNSEVPSVST